MYTTTITDITHTHNQQKTYRYSQGQKGTDVREWCGWEQWGNVILTQTHHEHIARTSTPQARAHHERKHTTSTPQTQAQAHHEHAYQRTSTP